MDATLDIGMVGLGTMGRNLALNMVDHGLRVGGFDKAPGSGDRLETESGSKARGFDTLEGLVGALASPRRVFLMVPAGPIVDAVISEIAPLLDAGDVVIDGGNSNYADTERRCRELSAKGITFIGAGVSGGESGARHGPSIMPGGGDGAEATWELVQPILEPIAARTPDGTPCCAWLGAGGCGHAVKTVHNGIEYAFMQAICECYAVLAGVGGLDADALAGVFGGWNTGDLRSFLLEITAKIFGVKDADGSALVDAVLDEARQKGTGRWTAEMALAFGAPAPTLAEAVFARAVSSQKPLRQKLNSQHRIEPGEVSPSLTEDLRDALLTTVLAAFIQGFDVIRAASDEHAWDVRLHSVSRIWRAGCIIRIDLLDRFAEAFEGGAEHLLLDEWIAGRIGDAEGGLRRAVTAAVAHGVGCPVMSSALAYLDTMREARLPHNLLQAQRDAFGAHTYRRADDWAAGEARVCHTDWLGDGKTELRP